MSLPPSSMDPRRADHARGESGPGRRGVLDLARVYLAASAYGDAVNVLDQLSAGSWDEEAHLLRAEGLLGMGRTAEAEALLGPPRTSSRRPGADRMPARWREDGELLRAPEAEVPTPTLPRWDAEAGKRRRPTRRERHAEWRLLLQLRVFHRTGRYREVIHLGRAHFEKRSLQPSRNVARIAIVMAQSLLALRRPAAARGLFSEIRDLNVRLRNPEGVTDALFGMANSQLLDCHWDEADALYQEARFRYEEIGQADKSLAALINLGVLRGKRGDLEAGRSLLLQALDRAAQLADRRRMLSIHLGLGMIEIRLGEPEMARRRLLTALREARRTGSSRSRALALEFLAELYMAIGRIARARACLLAGRAIALKIAPEGDLVFEIRRREAELAFREGSVAVARVCATEARDLALEYGDHYEAAVADRVLAEVDEACGRAEDALIRVLSAREALDRVGESYERARLELFRIRLEVRLGLLEPEEVCDHAREACRGFTSRPNSPLRQEARRLKGRCSPGSAPIL